MRAFRRRPLAMEFVLPRRAEAVLPFVEQLPSGFGRLGAVTHAAKLSKTPAFWARPAMPLGGHPPEWPVSG